MHYTLIRSTRRHRSLALRVTPAGEVIVRAPHFTPKFMIDLFVASKQDWLLKQSHRQTYSPTRHFSEQELKDYLHQELANFSNLLNLYPTRVEFKSVKSYWGNCSAKGVLRFNLHLTFAPPEAVSYVVVHELVHLKHKGHGKKFWDLVNQTYSRANEMRRVLRQIRYT